MKNTITREEKLKKKGKFMEDRYLIKNNPQREECIFRNGKVIWL